MDGRGVEGRVKAEQGNEKAVHGGDGLQQERREKEEGKKEKGGGNVAGLKEKKK